MEAFYTFTWAPKPRFQRPERGPGPNARPAPKASRAATGRKANGATARTATVRRPRAKGRRAEGRRPQGDRRPAKDFGGKGGKRDHGKDGPKPERKFEARPRGPKSRSTPTTPSPPCWR